MSLARPGPHATMREAAAAVLALVWLLAIATIAWPSDGLRMANAVAVTVLGVLTLLLGRPATRFLVVVLVAVATALAALYDDWAAFVTGLERGGLLAAVITTLSLLRVALQRDVRIDAYRELVAATPPERRPVWVLCGSYVTSSMLSLGSIPVFASLLPPGADETTRVRAARANACGASLAVLWSPFFVALALVTDYLPDLSLLRLIGVGMLLSFLGLGFALAASAEPGHRWRPALAAITALRGFLLPILLVTATLIAVRGATGLSTIATMLLVLPALCVILVALPPRAPLRAVGADLWGRLRRVGDEAAIVAAATVFGTLLSAVPWMDQVPVVSAMAGLPPAVLVFACIGFMVATGFLGVLPLVSGTIVLVVLTGIPSAVTDLAIAMSVLAGWGLGSMASVASLMVLVTANQYEVRPERIVFGRNLRFLFSFAPVAGLLIVAIDAVASRLA